MLFRVLYIRNQDAALQAQLMVLILASGSRQYLQNTIIYVGVRKDQAVFLDPQGLAMSSSHLQANKS